MLTSAKTLSEAHQEIACFFSSVLGIEVPSPTTDLFASGALDSQNLIELIIHIEKLIGVPVGLDDFDIEQCRCIANIAKLVIERQAQVSDNRQGSHCDFHS
jgi:acyl carrier protein